MLGGTCGSSMELFLGVLIVIGAFFVLKALIPALFNLARGLLGLAFILAGIGIGVLAFVELFDSSDLFSLFSVGLVVSLISLPCIWIGKKFIPQSGSKPSATGQNVRIEGSSWTPMDPPSPSLKGCSYCGGLGNLLCSTCGGSGNVWGKGTCIECGGSGRSACLRCGEGGYEYR